MSTTKVYFEERKKQQESCDHDNGDEGTRIGYFTHQGIQRTGIFCRKCGLLMDYMPQYSEDDL